MSINGRSIDERSDFNDSAREFEKVACGFISKCFEKNREAAFTLLIRTVSCIGNRTCLELAKSAEALDFVSEKCVQSLVGRLWFGKIRGNDSFLRNFVIFISTFTVFPLFSLQYDFHDDKPEKNKHGLSLAEGRYLANGRRPKRKEFLSPMLFFYDAPAVKFTCTIIVHMIFLLAASYDLLITYNSYQMTYTSFTQNYVQWFLIAYVGSLLLEEVMELFQYDGGTINTRHYLKDWWNTIDWTAITLFGAAMLLGNLSVPAESQSDMLHAGRVFYACSLLLFYVKILYWYHATQEFGQMVYVVGRMMRELALFWVIFLVFIVAWGVAQWALLFPQTPAQWSLIRDLLSMSFWNLFTQFHLDKIRSYPLDMNTECTNISALYTNYTQVRCSDPIGQQVVPIFLGGYAVITSILLINLLISLFGQVMEDKERTKKRWQFESMRLVLAFVGRSSTVPPFTILSLLGWGLNTLKNCARKTRCKSCVKHCPSTVYPENFLPTNRLAYGSTYISDYADLLLYHDLPFQTWMTKVREDLLFARSTGKSVQTEST